MAKTTTTQDFWKKSADLIAVTEKHPFLVAIVNGTLSLDSFRHCVVQDAGAGILLRRHLMTSCVEGATALPMDVVSLDPNAQGSRLCMSTVEKSLVLLFLEPDADSVEDLYVLAHSMAGSQLVRFFHNRTSCCDDESFQATVRHFFFTADQSHCFRGFKPQCQLDQKQLHSHKSLGKTHVAMHQVTPIPRRCQGSGSSPS